MHVIKQSRIGLFLVRLKTSHVFQKNLVSYIRCLCFGPTTARSVRIFHGHGQIWLATQPVLAPCWLLLYLMACTPCEPWRYLNPPLLNPGFWISRFLFLDLFDQHTYVLLQNMLSTRAWRRWSSSNISLGYIITISWVMEVKSSKGCLYYIYLQVEKKVDLFWDIGACQGSPA
jgi:hypothetical protein